MDFLVSFSGFLACCVLTRGPAVYHTVLTACLVAWSPGALVRDRAEVRVACRASHLGYTRQEGGSCRIVAVYSNRVKSMESHASLQAKVSGFVPGVDMVDGKCDIETAHYFLQIFADGDVYTVRRTAISFVELDRDLMKRFPKLALPVLPIYSLSGASKLKKAKRSSTSDKFGKDVLVPVDDLMTLQPVLTSYICSLMAIEPVLACDEMRTFMVSATCV